MLGFLLLSLVTITHCSAQNDFFDVMNNGKKEWRLAFRGTAYARKSVFAAYKDGTGIPSNIEAGCKQPNSTALCYNHYRNGAVLDNWHNIAGVAFVVYQNSRNVKQAVFDGTGTTFMDWFQKSRLKSSTWPTLATEPFQFFSIEGDAKLNRRFFINHNYGSCPNDAGWFVAIDMENGACNWELEDGFPVFKYAKGDKIVNWNKDFGRADMIAVFVKYTDNAVVG